MTLTPSMETRRTDWARHIQDLATASYEGANERSAREDVFHHAFELTTPVAVRVLGKIDEIYLGGTGEVSVTPPEPTNGDGLLGSWNLTWPLLERARSRFTNGPLPPVQIFAMFPPDFTHGHLALFDIDAPRRWVACWPFQVTGNNDADRQEMILWAIAEAEVHERTFAGDLNWRLLPMAEVSAFTRS
jgi:hypothetical protein